MAVFAAKGMPIFQLRADGKGTKNTGQYSPKEFFLRRITFFIFKISNPKLTQVCTAETVVVISNFGMITVLRHCPETAERYSNNMNVLI